MSKRKREYNDVPYTKIAAKRTKTPVPLPNLNFLVEQRDRAVDRMEGFNDEQLRHLNKKIENVKNLKKYKSEPNRGRVKLEGVPEEIRTVLIAGKPELKYFVYRIMKDRGWLKNKYGEKLKVHDFMFLAFADGNIAMVPRNPYSIPHYKNFCILAGGYDEVKKMFDLIPEEERF
jgi:hypothetical protein